MMNFGGDLLSTIPGERRPRPSEYYLNNNTFTENNFGYDLPAPFFGTPVTPGKVIDGGGNFCPQPAGPYPLVCH
jgi:hypothetical protein